MLDWWIIERIEEEKRRKEEVFVPLQLPLYDEPPSERPSEEEKAERGICIIELV